MLKTKQTSRLLSRALEAGVPAGLDAFFVRCLARDPAERFPSAVEAGAAWAALAAPTA